MARNDTSSGDECTVGGYPEYAVNVSSVLGIQLAVNFVRNLNIRLVIKNTGHCYLGKSTGAGSVSLWTHNLKNIEYIPDFEAEGYSGKAFKIGAGVTVEEIYRAADAHGVSVQGGVCPVCLRIFSDLHRIMTLIQMIECRIRRWIPSRRRS